MARKMTIEEELEALGYEDAKQRIMRFERAVEPHCLAFTGDGRRLGVVYRDGDVVLVWTDTTTCIVTSPHAPAEVVRLAKTDRSLYSLTQRICRNPYTVFQTAVDAYRVKHGLPDADEQQALDERVTHDGPAYSHWVL